MSYTFHYPKVRLYQGLGCSKTARNEAQDLNTECTSTADSGGYGYGDDQTSRKAQMKPTADDDANGDDQYGGYYGDQGNVALFDMWSLANTQPTIPTAQPTVPVPRAPTVPTLRPTMKPTTTKITIGTSAPTTIIASSPSASPTNANAYFQVTYSQVSYLIFFYFYLVISLSWCYFVQVLEGVTVQEWNKNAIDCFQSFRLAIIKLLPAITEENVQPLRVLEPTGITNACNITYQITGTISQHHVSDASIAVDRIADALTKAIAGGTFDIYLRYYALSFELTELIGVKSSHFQSLHVNVMDSSTASDSTSSDSVGDNADTQALTIAFTVIAVMVVIAVGGMSISRCCQSKERTHYTEVSLESDSMHSSVNNPLASSVMENGRKGMGEDEEDGEVTIEMRSLPASTLKTSTAV
jgi:hypothetical protein